MNQNKDTFKYNEGDHIGKFKVLRKCPVEILQVVYYELVHEPTGAKMIHLACNDDNNVFMVSFRTIPTDSTGVAHILEHSVLEASRKYPVQIYKNLSGRTLNTFLNAMTGPDYTAYPFSSRNKVDFFNLLNVYLDATFFPQLKKETFLQEGWRLEFEKPNNPESPLVYRGVVYNEMKGAMSSSMRLFYEAGKQALYPDLVYSHISGGDPRKIPDLTYEDWKDFHARHYHPSNAYFYTYGDIPMEEIIAVYEDWVLKEFDKIAPPPPTPFQKSYDKPRVFRSEFPVSANDEIKGKSFIAVMWKLAPTIDFYEQLKLSLLNMILCGDDSSILSRALLASGLGDGLAPIGYENSYIESMMGTGLTNTDEDKAETVENLIMETLKKTLEDGIPRDDIEAALHQFEISVREIKGDHGVPFGLYIAMKGMNVWMNQGDFLKTLTVDTFLDRLRQESQDPEFFKSLITHYLIDNPHRATVILVPSKGGAEQMELELNKKLAEVQNRLADAEKQELIAQSKRLVEHQKKSKDASVLPTITIQDINPIPEFMESVTSQQCGQTVYTHVLPTNGIDYLNLVFEHDFYASYSMNLTAEKEFAYLLLNILPSLGAGSSNYIEMGQRINKYAGSLNISFAPFRKYQHGDHRLAVMVTSKCLTHNQSQMLDIIHDMLRQPDLNDHRRLSEMINMKKAYALPMVGFSGHRMAGLAAGRILSPLKHMIHDFDGLGYVQRILEFLPEKTPGIAQCMKDLLNQLITRKSATLGLTGSEASLSAMMPRLNDFLARISENGEESRSEGGSPDSISPVREAWLINTEVSYVARAIPVVPFEHRDSPVLMVISQLMEIPLYDRIRAKGGAYGAFAGYDSESAIFNIMTYRDPHTGKSLKAFDEVVDEIGSANFTTENLQQAIIETIRGLDIPPSPREKGLRALYCRLRGETLAMRTKHRQGILNMTKSDICRVMDLYFSRPTVSGVAIVTSEDICRRAETAALNLERISLLGK